MDSTHQDHKELRLARIARGLTQAQLAERIGTTQQTVDRIERGLVSFSRHVPAMRKELTGNSEEKPDDLRAYVLAVADGERMPTERQWSQMIALAQGGEPAPAVLPGNGGVSPEKIAAALEKDGRSARAVSAECRMSPDWLRTLLDGRAKKPSYAAMTRLATALGLTPEDLMA